MLPAAPCFTHCSTSAADSPSARLLRVCCPTPYGARLTWHRISPTHCTTHTGGEDIPVSEESRHEYVELMVDYLMYRSVDWQFNAFSHGFRMLCDGPAIHLFNAQVRGGSMSLAAAVLPGLACCSHVQMQVACGGSLWQRWLCHPCNRRCYAGPAYCPLLAAPSMAPVTSTGITLCHGMYRCYSAHRQEVARTDTSPAPAPPPAGGGAPGVRQPQP